MQPPGRAFVGGQGAQLLPQMHLVISNKGRLERAYPDLLEQNLSWLGPRDLPACNTPWLFLGTTG